MKIKEVALTLERFAPLPLQESYDNAGLQVGLTEAEASGVLLCLDVTEAVIDEACRKGCNMIVAHHPLLFRGLKCISDVTWIQRIVRKAVRNDVAIYAAHTNLDNAEGGVNFEIARLLGLKDVRFLRPMAGNERAGSGIIGELSEVLAPEAFVSRVKQTFDAERICCAPGPQKEVRTVALCGGAGDFLAEDAAKAGADVFITGEMHYHSFFDYADRMWTLSIGHYESERCVIGLMHRILADAHAGLRIEETEINTNPIKYF